MHILSGSFSPISGVIGPIGPPNNSVEAESFLDFYNPNLIHNLLSHYKSVLKSGICQIQMTYGL